MNRSSKVTLGKYNAVKILIQSGATYKEIAESMGLSTCTVGMIGRSASIEEYRHSTYVGSSYYRKKIEKELKAKQDAETKAAEEAAAKGNETPKDPEKQEDTQPVQELRQIVKIEAPQYMMSELRKTNELLAAISNKLAFIVEELTGKVE